MFSLVRLKHKRHFFSLFHLLGIFFSKNQTEWSFSYGIVATATVMKIKVTVFFKFSGWETNIKLCDTCSKRFTRIGYYEYSMSVNQLLIVGEKDKIWTIYNIIYWKEQSNLYT